jgi:hypothetical protein
LSITGEKEIMKRNLLNLIAICVLAGLVAGLIPAAAVAQDTSAQKPQLLIKIRNLDQFLNDVDKLMSAVQESKTAPPQTAMLRGMLQGTDWIDPQRSIVAGIMLKDPKPEIAILVPFRKENPGFKAMLGATAGENYYLGTIPPQPGFSVSPAMKDALLKASSSVTKGSLVIEAAAGPLLDQVEPQMNAAMKMAVNSPQAQANPGGISPQASMEAVSSFLKIFRQAETVRYGLDISGDTLTLLFDMDALPNTPLSGLLSDPGGDSRFSSYPIDMPIQLRTRANDMAGMVNLLMGSGLDSFYRQMGIDFGRMGDIVKQFTGEMAGGANFSSNGIAMEFVYVLKPGVDGDSFISKTYMPWLEKYGSELSSAASKQTGNPPVPIYKRTADSTVAGVKVRGVKGEISAILPPEMRKNEVINKFAVESRIAAIGDMMFVAPSDAQLEALIRKSQSFKKSPAQGPIIQAEVDLGAFIKGIQSFIPPTGKSVVWPDNLGKMTMAAEMNNGKLATQTSFNMDVLRKLVAVIRDSARKQAAPPAGTK